MKKVSSYIQIPTHNVSQKWVLSNDDRQTELKKNPLKAAILRI